MTAEEIAAEVARLGPWITGFTAAGRDFGGSYFAEHDARAKDFVAHLRSRRPDAARILECGCLDGGHTAVLAGGLPLATIVATDVREDNLRRAALLARVRGLTNIAFVADDLEEPAASLAGAYDAIFCVGLLYHLRDPAKFLRRCAASSPLLWLWTVYCAEDAATLLEGPHRGRLYAEPVDHPLSAVRPESFFPTLGSLVEMTLFAGYRRVEILNRELTANGNGPAVLLCASRP
jgi:SAM-dependent methyltransferase